MTIFELINLPHVLSENVEGKFYKVTVTDGYYLTAYQDTSDIKEYIGINFAYFPNSNNLPEYRIISEEEHKEYERRREEAEDEQLNQQEDN